MVYFSRWLRLNCNCVIDLFRVIRGILGKKKMSIVFQEHVCMPRTIVVLKCKALFQQVLIQLAYGFADFLRKKKTTTTKTV